MLHSTKFPFKVVYTTFKKNHESEKSNRHSFSWCNLYGIFENGIKFALVNRSNLLNSAFGSIMLVLNTNK